MISVETLTFAQSRRKKQIRSEQTHTHTQSDYRMLRCACAPRHNDIHGDVSHAQCVYNTLCMLLRTLPNTLLVASMVWSISGILNILSI